MDLVSSDDKSIDLASTDYEHDMYMENQYEGLQKDRDVAESCVWTIQQRKAGIGSFYDFWEGTI